MKVTQIQQKDSCKRKSKFWSTFCSEITAVFGGVTAFVYAWNTTPVELRAAEINTLVSIKIFICCSALYASLPLTAQRIHQLLTVPSQQHLAFLFAKNSWQKAWS